MRFAITSSTTVTGRPFSSATRSRKRRLERDLAAHRAFGDGGDMRLEADEIGQFVDAFLADHGGIHVGDQQLLAPMRHRLHHDVEFAVQCVAQLSASLRGSVRCRCEGDVGRDPGRAIAVLGIGSSVRARKLFVGKARSFGSAMKVATCVMRANRSKSAAYCSAPCRASLTGESARWCSDVRLIALSTRLCRIRGRCG